MKIDAEMAIKRNNYYHSCQLVNLPVSIYNQYIRLGLNSMQKRMEEKRTGWVLRERCVVPQLSFSELRNPKHAGARLKH